MHLLQLEDAWTAFLLNPLLILSVFWLTMVVRMNLVESAMNMQSWMDASGSFIRGTGACVQRETLDLIWPLQSGCSFAMQMIICLLMR